MAAQESTMVFGKTVSQMDKENLHLIMIEVNMRENLLMDSDMGMVLKPIVELNMLEILIKVKWIVKMLHMCIVQVQNMKEKFTTVEDKAKEIAIIPTAINTQAIGKMI